MLHDATGDVALLHAYEPVLAYTRGEYFLPTDVGRYVADCGLWQDAAGGDRVELVAPGSLDLDQLTAAADARPDTPLDLRYVQKAASSRQVRRWRKEFPTGIRRTGRLAAVGFVARMIDVGLRASLFVRGSVPGGVMAAAARQYKESGGAEASPYYGRVVRDGGYTICQYWYFYAANDWRSTFGGVNDHEADWEMVTVYLAERSDGTRPLWVAFSSHDYVGDDLRRRWDDPELTLVGGDHPVVFAGAGSHSGAFLPGDYLVTVNPRLLGTLTRGWKRVFGLLRRGEDSSQAGFGIPFIDYARGDGVRIGPNEEREWTPVLIDDETPWVRAFRGLWGRDTRDWAGGERAPAGPRYERDGTVRQSWADPVGWAGLHKVAPDLIGLADGLRSRIGELDARIAEIAADTHRLRYATRTRHAEVLSLRTEFQESRVAAERLGEVLVAEDSVSRMVQERTTLAEERAVHERVLKAGFPEESPRAHLKHHLKPYDPADGGRGALLQIWAAVSVPLLLLAVVTVLLLPNDEYPTIPYLGVILVVFAVVEAVVRKRLMTAALSFAVVIVGAAFVLDVLSWAARNARAGFLIAMALAGVLLLGANIRDYFRR